MELTRFFHEECEIQLTERLLQVALLMHRMELATYIFDRMHHTQVPVDLSSSSKTWETIVITDADEFVWHLCENGGFIPTAAHIDSAERNNARGCLGYLTAAIHSLPLDGALPGDRDRARERVQAPPD